FQVLCAISAKKTSSLAFDWPRPSRNDTRISKEAHQKGEYYTEINAKEAHHSKDTGLPRWQSVCLNFDPRAKKGHPMIGND
ncbi:hypothetical protein Tco_1179153, partial [Tanacetum coccineum]